jgi:hypothetical protein
MEKAPEWPPNFNLLGRIFPEGKLLPKCSALWRSNAQADKSA